MGAKVKLIFAILGLVLACYSLYVAVNVLEEQQARERILCFQILDRFGEDDVDCAAYKEEWKELDK